MQKENVMTRSINSADNYFSQVLKYIPTEIILAYVSIEGILTTAYKGKLGPLEAMLLYVAIGLMVLTPLWLWRVMGVKSLAQLFLSTLSFPLWLFAMGGPFAYMNWYEPALGSIALPFFTLLAPIITGRLMR